MKIKALKAAFPITLPVLTGYLFLGMAFGLLMNKAGFSFIWSFLMSATVFAGAMQFAGIGLLTTAFNPLSALLLTLLVNIRHIFYGVSMLEKYKGSGNKKFLMIFMMADEAFSINAAASFDDSIDRGWFYFFTSLLCYLYWQVSTWIGHLIGQLFPGEIKGLDFVLTALFYILFLNQWEHKENRPTLLLGLGATLISLIFMGKTQFLLGSMVLILIVILSKMVKEGSHHD